VTGPYLIGCDVGSQGTNAALYAADGTLVASAYEAYDVAFPHPGWAEQDPRLWTAAVAASIARLLAQVPEGPAAVKGLSFGSQLDGMVVCDAKGEPLRPAMIWMDRRAEPQAAAVAARLSPADFYHHTGANLDSSHAVFKALWVRDQEPEVFAEAAHLMPPGSYVLRDAAGVLAVDWSNASSLALLDPRTRAWSAPVLDAVGVEAAMLPELAPGTQAVEPVTHAFAERTGLAPDTVVVVGCGDEMAATLGAGVRPRRGLRRRRHRRAGVRRLGGAGRGPGHAGRVPSPRRPRRLAAGEPRVRLRRQLPLVARPVRAPGAGGGGRRPGRRLRPADRAGRRGATGGRGAGLPALHAGRDGPRVERGRPRGLLRAHPRPHPGPHDQGPAGGQRLRAARHPRGMGAAGLEVRRLTIVGGGAKGALWRQIKADVTGLPVRVPTSVETTATGAAILAAVGSGVHAGVADAVAAFVAYQPDEHVPDPERHQRYSAAYRRYRDVYYALKPVFEKAEAS
jgi:xylulokinase